MTKTTTYKPKQPFDILQSLLHRIDPNHCIYGPSLCDLLDPVVPVETIPREIELCLSSFRYDKLIGLFEDVGFLRTSIVRNISSNGDNCKLSTLDIVINDVPFTLDVLSGNQAQLNDIHPDFTCNNLFQKKLGKGTYIGIMKPDPSEKMSNDKFLSCCIRDIYQHKLVPMVPDDLISITEKTPANKRRQHVKMIRQAIKMLNRGWTLEPSLTGKKLEFTRYQNNDDKESCAICQEKHDPTTSIVLVCGHAFHIDCLYRQMCEEGPTSYKCALCNKHILFTGTHQLKPDECTHPEEDEQPMTGHVVVRIRHPIQVGSIHHSPEDLEDENYEDEEEVSYT